MSQSKRKARRESPLELGLTASTAGRAAGETIAADDNTHSSSSSASGAARRFAGSAAYLRNPSHWWVVGLIALFSLGAMGAGLKYLEESAQKQKAANAISPNNAKNQSQSWLNSLNPFAEPPLPTATPQLSKEIIYAGSRMLTVEDANANAAPPADLAVWRPSNGYWYVLGGQGSQQTSYQWGASEDKPVPGDYDGDGKTDFSVFRPSNGYWYVSNSSNGNTTELYFGAGTDVKAQADYDGDGKTDIAVYRPATTGTWFLVRSSAGSYQVDFGTTGDIPAPADYDGDGKADIAVWRPGSQTFYAVRSSDGTLLTQPLGQTTSDLPVSGDYDGDGKADFAIKSGNVWIIRQSTNNQSVSIAWQDAADIPVQNDYDGDGKVDIAVWRASIGYWFIRQSSLGGQLRQAQWGASTDIPVPAFYRR